MFLADENIELATVLRLRADGHDVVYVAELAPGIGDDEVLAIASREHRMLLTGDKDFGELVHRLGRTTDGVILVRLVGLPPQTKADLVAAVVGTHLDELRGAFTVIAPGQVRIRKPSTP